VAIVKASEFPAARRGSAGAAESTPVQKGAAAQRMAREGIVLSLGDLRSEGERLVAEARAAAAEILASARRQAQALIDTAEEKGIALGVERGFEQGRAAGEQSGRNDAQAQLREQASSLNAAMETALQSWEAERETIMRQAAQDIVGFSVALARRIVKRLPEIDADVVAGQLEAAIRLVGRPTSMVVRIHPEDEALVNALLPDYAAKIAQCREATTEVDPSMNRGGVIIRTVGGEVDASIETQLDRLTELVLGEVAPE